MTIKISIHEPMPMSAVSYYRSIGTLSYLHRLNQHIKIDIPTSISWNAMLDTDIFYMERPQQNSDIQAMQLVKDFNVKIWVDYDDLLHGIPKYNPSYKHFNQESIIKNIETAMTMADIVTVSTPYLKEYYSKFNKNIHVIENAHNDYKYPFEKITETVESINWRGSPTHRQDLLSVSENMFNLANKYNKWAWTLIGDEVWFITEHIKNCFNVPECDIITYNKLIKDLKSAIQIVPLLFSDFNSSKSNIGWIEGTYAGSTTIAPLLPEFDKPGVINYTEKENSFGYHLEKAIVDVNFRKKKYIESYEYIKENLMLSKINFKRLEIIEGLMSC